MKINFDEDVYLSRAALKKATLLGKIGAYLTLGLWSNSKKIEKASGILSDALRDSDLLKEAQQDISRIHSMLDEFVEENGVRVAVCMFPDVTLDGRHTYGPNWLEIRQTILVRDDYACQHADGRCNGPLQIHHRRPLSKGGTNEGTNLVTLCRYHHGQQHPGNPNFAR